MSKASNEEEEPTLLLLDNILSSIQSKTTQPRRTNSSSRRRDTSHLSSSNKKVTQLVQQKETSSIGMKDDDDGDSSSRFHEKNKGPIQSLSETSSIANQIPESFQRRMRQAEKNERQIAAAALENKLHSGEEVMGGIEQLKPPPSKIVNGDTSSSLSIKSSSVHSNLVNKKHILDDDDEDEEVETRPKPSKSDQLAIDTFGDFEQELTRWWCEHDDSEPKHRCESYANYLNAKYLCQRLDPLERSPIVSSIRKKVARALEDLTNVKRYSASRVVPKVNHMNISSGGGGGGGSVHQRAQPLKSASERKQRSSDNSNGSSNNTSHHPPTNHTALVPAVRTVSVNKSTGKRHWCTQREGDWNCATCSKLNFEEDEKCVICGRLKPQTLPPPLNEKDSLTLDIEALNMRKDKSLYSEAEKKKQQEMDKIQNEYRNFIQTKLRLDSHADTRRDFASEIQSVLSGIQVTATEPLVQQHGKEATTHKLDATPPPPLYNHIEGLEVPKVFKGSPFLVDRGEEAIRMRTKK